MQLPVLRAYGLVKNTSHVEQQLGTFRIPPHAIGRLPIEVVEDLRKHPIAALRVVEDHPDLVPFVRTEHLPDSPRYQ